jgi:hypothetical protein
VEDVEVLLREYDTLRRESLDSITHRTQVASFGLAAVGALFAAPFLAPLDSRSTTLLMGILAVGIPLVSVLVLRMWLGEFERMHRAGSYLCWLEHRINSALGDHLLTWESWLRDGDRLFYPYISVVALFTLIGLGAPMAAVISAEASPWDWLAAIPGMVATLAAGTHAAFRVYRPRFRVDAARLQAWFEAHRNQDRMRVSQPSRSKNATRS